MPVARGTWIGPYEIVDWLGAGGMGEVYRARDPRLDRDVAIKLLDFGIAKLTRPSDDTPRRSGLATETEPGMTLGTAAYMSPDQVRGETVDHRSDIFSFGAILYEMLT